MEAYADGLPKVNPSNLQLYDQMFLSVLQKEAKIELFLDSVFNFLYRKTDFFRFLTKENPSIGFRPGDANRLVEGYFTRYMQMSVDAYTEAAKQAKEQNERKEVKAKESELLKRDMKEKSTTKNNTEPKTVKMTEAIVENLPNPLTSEKQEPTIKKVNPPKSIEIPKAIDANPENDTQNGGQTDKYSWNQTHDEIEVNIKVPNFIDKANQIKVDFKQTPLPWMKVKFLEINAGKAGAAASKNSSPKSSENENLKNSFYLDGELHGPINKEDSTWSFDKTSKNLNISLAKNSTLWWDRVRPDDKPIDMAKVNCIRPMSDMSIEEQATINKLRYDQQQKRIGKASSEQERTLEALRKGWNAEGSPFKGTNFDPDKVNLDGVQ